MTRTPKRPLGRLELVDFPEFNLTDIEAKVDTGAYTSAIHCTDIHVENGPDGQPRLLVRLLDPDHAVNDGRPLAFRNFALREIRSSNGEAQERYVIRATVRLYGEDLAAEFSLSDRSDMKYPVLLGRSLLQRGRFVVDVARRHLSHKAVARAQAARNGR